MSKADFIIGIKRRKIEDSILALYRQVDFTEPAEIWLAKKALWDFVYSWFNLMKYYEESQDTTLGVNMLDLYADCADRLRAAAISHKLKERQRDKAADALHQINYLGVTHFNEL
jgi:hypothetical protein